MNPIAVAHKQHNKSSSVLRAIATLPARSNLVTTDMKSAPALQAGSTSATTVVRDRQPQSAPMQSPHSASGSLDRIAGRPISAAVYKEETGPSSLGSSSLTAVGAVQGEEPQCFINKNLPSSIQTPDPVPQPAVNTAPAISEAPISETASTSSSTSQAIEAATHQRLRGSFLTSSKEVDLSDMMRSSELVVPVLKVSCLEVSANDLEDLILSQVEGEGVPLVISDLHKTSAWSSDLFNTTRYQQLHSAVAKEPRRIQVRDQMNLSRDSLPLKDYIDHCDQVREYSPADDKKLYAKDLLCPTVWSEAVAEIVHPRLRNHGDNDLAASLAPRARINTQKCCYGPGRTCTPWRRNHCSSLGQDMMVSCQEGAASIWFFALPEHAALVDSYIGSRGGNAESEVYAPHPDEILGQHDFPVFCCEQQLGDLVLIPSGAPHMTLNRGGPAMRIAWTRMTVSSLRRAIMYDLPSYQRSCRKERFHVKAVVEESLIKFTQRVESALNAGITPAPRVVHDLRKLLKLYDGILSDEYLPEWRQISLEGDSDSYVECDFCGADVLHAYFECSRQETLCTMCYCQGRLCSCEDAVEQLKPHQHYLNFGQRLQIRNTAAEILLKVIPDAAQPTSDTENGAEDQEGDENEVLALTPIKILEEDAVGKEAWPLSFMAAYRLFNIRKSEGWREDTAPCKICKADLDRSQRYYCKQCRDSYCYGCFLHRAFIHPVHVLAQKHSLQFHHYHRKSSKLDYTEWKEEPLAYCIEARTHFSLIEAALTKMKGNPIVSGCKIGFLDVSDEHPFGLSGTLGVKHPKKGSKTRSMAPGSSPVSVSVPQKRRVDVAQPPSSVSPRMPRTKKLKVNVPPSSDPMQGQGQVMVNGTRPVLPSSNAAEPVEAQAQSSDSAGAPAVSGEPSPTVAHGIRKFVLRQGKLLPSPPILASSPPSSSAPSVSSSLTDVVESPARISDFTESPHLTSTSSDRPVTMSTSDEARGAQAGDRSSDTLAIVSAATIQSALSPTRAAAANAQHTVGKVAVPIQASQSSGKSDTAVSSIASTDSPITSTVATLSTAPSVAVPPPTGQSNGISTPEPSAVTASLVAAGTVPESGSSASTISGLASVDQLNLRVITEVLRIFSQANQKSMQDAQTRLAEGLKQHLAASDARSQQSHTDLKASMEQSQTKLEATIVQENRKLHEAISQLSSENRTLRREVGELKRQLKSSEALSKKTHEMVAAMWNDIDLGVREAVEAGTTVTPSLPADTGSATRSST